VSSCSSCAASPPGASIINSRPSVHGSKSVTQTDARAKPVHPEIGVDKRRLISTLVASLA
jgi:hypothetical protein